MTKQLKRMRFGYVLMIASWLFSIIETAYFGCNLIPQSMAEMICDHIAGYGVMIGIILLITSNNRSNE